MPLQSAATTLLDLRQSPFILTAAEVVELTETIDKAARSGALLLPLPSLSAMNEADHPVQQSLTANAQQAAITLALSLGLLSTTGLWSAVPVDGFIDLSAHPSYSQPYNSEWTAINARCTATAILSERALWVGTDPAIRSGRYMFNEVEYASYIPGSGYVGAVTIDLDLGDARARWLSQVSALAIAKGYGVSLDNRNRQAGGIPLDVWRQWSGFFVMW